MLLRMASSDHAHRVQRLVAGIVALAVVIGLCVVALVVLFDRFTAHVGDDCPESGCVTRHYSCNEKGNAAVGDLLKVVRRLDAATKLEVGTCDSGTSAGVTFVLPGRIDEAVGVVRRTWDCARKQKPRNDEDGDRYFLCTHDGIRFDLDLARDDRAGGFSPLVDVEARPVR